VDSFLATASKEKLQHAKHGYLPILKVEGTAERVGQELHQ